MATVPTPATVDAEALATQEAVANTSREGATLPRDETADVLSGAVVPPGKEAPGQTTPGRGTKARRRSARASTGTAGAATADVTGGTQDEEGSEVSEEEEEEEFATEEDDEDRLIAQGGMGIPIDEVRSAHGCLLPHDGN
jgi:RNA polymerase II subunit A small phosphatase-like protein